MNFGDVLTKLKTKGYLTRPIWQNRTYIYLDGGIIMYSSLGVDYVWVAPHVDLLALDWVEIIPTR